MVSKINNQQKGREYILRYTSITLKKEKGDVPQTHGPCKMHVCCINPRVQNNLVKMLFLFSYFISYLTLVLMFNICCVNMYVCNIYQTFAFMPLT